MRRKRSMGRLRRVLAAPVAALLALGAPAAAFPDPETARLVDRLDGLAAAIADETMAHLTAADLLSGAGFEPVAGTRYPGAARPAAQMQPPEIETLDVRLALAMLAQTFGAESNQGVLNAMARGQGGGEFRGLVVRSGRASLADLRLFAVRLGLQPDEPGPFVLRVPVVVWDGASLQIGPGERLRLSRPDGAFVANFGDLRVIDAAIEGWGPESLGTPSFRPFVVTSGGGTSVAEGAELIDLGFGRTQKFGGFTVLNNPLVPMGGSSRIVNSRLSGVSSVAASSAHAIEIRGNRFENGDDAPIELRMTRDAEIVGNVFVGDAPANAIRLLSGSRGAIVVGNVILRGDKTGIAVRGGSDRARIEGNVVWDRHGGGITVDRSHCALVRGNTLLGNRRKGIEVRGGAGALVADNVMVGNRSAAVWVSNQSAQTTTRIEHNRLVANGAGLSTASGGRIELIDVDFSDQFPRFLGGDAASDNHRLAMGGLQSVTMTLETAGPGDGRRAPDCDG